MHFLITVQPRCALSLRDSCPRQVHGPGSILVARSEMRQSKIFPVGAHGLPAT